MYKPKQNTAVYKSIPYVEKGIQLWFENLPFNVLFLWNT